MAEWIYDGKYGITTDKTPIYLENIKGENYNGKNESTL